MASPSDIDRAQAPSLESVRLERIVTWFNRNSKVHVEPPCLAPYVKGVKHITTKQAPSCLLLRKTGNPSLYKCKEVLLKAGFPMPGKDYTNLTKLSTSGLTPSELSSFSQLMIEMEEANESMADSSDGEEEEILPSPATEKMEKTPSRFCYDDPWKIFAGRTFCEVNGRPLPSLKVWAGDGIRLQDPLPARVLGPLWKGSLKNRIRFQAIRDIEVQAYVISHHTHWGNFLMRVRKDPKHNEYAWAQTFWKRLRHFLEGKTDPTWSKRKRSRLLQDTEPRSRPSRCHRLIELMKTVDGIFLQRYLAYPEEVWTWSKYDWFILKNIDYLLADEFLDGAITKDGVAHPTTYEQLKQLRKAFKEAAHKGKLLEWIASSSWENAWSKQFRSLYAMVAAEGGMRQIFLIGLLSQTRGCGTPPPSLVLRSKLKFLNTISSEPKVVSTTQKGLWYTALEEVLSKLPEEAFTGLATKARITVTTSASWEHTRKTGGTTQAIADIVIGGEAGRPVMIIDLESGRFLEYAFMKDLTPGEYIFWTSLEVIRKMPRCEVTHAFLTTVKEPGKARTVTKARACLKVILDLVSKICASPMKKGIDSSKSGMGKAHHGWNFFLGMYSEGEKQELFNLIERDQLEYGGYTEVTETYSPLFVSSTDYEEATDQMLHEFAAMAGDRWMRKCGIPRVLRALVYETCFKPRRVFFHGTGCLSDIGEPAVEFGQGIRSVVLRKGVLMGDPLTKVVLHLANLVTRSISNNMRNVSWLSTIMENPAEFAHNVDLGLQKAASDVDPESA